MRLQSNERNSGETKKETKSITSIFQQAAKSSDFHQFSLSEEQDLTISYYKSMVDSDKINNLLLPALQEHYKKISTINDVKKLIPFEDVEVTTDPVDLEKKLIKGYVILEFSYFKRFLAINVENSNLGYRENNDTENEFSVIGPKVGFVEDLSTNLHLIRKKLPIPELVFEEIKVGSMSKTEVVIAYIDGITNPEYIETARQRLENVDFDVIFDNSIIDQLISDNSNSPFPIFLSTERTDRVVYAMINGQVAILSNGSPYIITGPTTILDFFISPEDYFLNWVLGSFFRIIRIMSVIFSLFATPIYVAILTFHYEVLPDDLLQPLISSRAHVPFPPMWEAIFLETTIELLREAGARLPTKIGQTLGIVGGIVIGQASVQAALTSNILLIIVSLSALASFTTPIFKMSNAIRLLRFPLILLAAFMGGFGIIIGFVLILGHLLKLKSLGNPYMVPLYPFRIKSFSDTFIRSPYQFTTTRSSFLRPLSLKRYNPKKNKDDRHEE
ncbi:spore germination protein [Bacillus sp. AFS055030]|uniref:spore germination protein n=1 Tax=Bacillus sp. AFS055030 TaxID=2033507 RepID=UPI000BFDF212|nr:spore germination protein [Bacillus sp. AFS055030]PGL70990.1 spore germination protein [Bacillus sp. AFS055030]